MRVWILVVMLLLSANLAGAKRAVESTDQMVVRYDNLFNEGRDLDISVQVMFNMSYLQVLIDGENDTIPAYTGSFDTWIPGDFVDFTVDSQYLPAGEYQGRAVAKPHNASFGVYTVFFDFTVNKVLDDRQVAIASSVIAVIAMLPFLYLRDKRKVERKLWNVIGLREYLRLRFLSRWAVILYVLIVGGGVYVWTL